MVEKFKTQEGCQTVLQRMQNDSNFVIGSAVDAANVSNPNMEENTLQAGDVIRIPGAEELPELTFKQTIGRGVSYGCIVRVVSGPDEGLFKRLHLGSFRKRIQVYNKDTMRPVMDGNSVKVVSSTAAVNQTVKTAPTIGAALESIAGKDLKVQEAEGSPCVGPRWIYGENGQRTLDGVSLNQHVFDFMEEATAAEPVVATAKKGKKG